MQYKNTIEAIYISLEEVQGLISEIGTEREIRSIDIDLAADKLRHIYDLLNQLKSETVHIEENNINEGEPSEQLNIKREKEGSVVEFDMDREPETQKQENKNKKKETETGPIEDIQEEKPQKTQAEIDSRVKLSSGKRYLGESFEKKSSSLNEEFSKKINPTQLTEKLTSKPISNIGSGLGLNEKFEIINNLFKGDKEKFEYTIQVLNAASDFNDAYEYIAHNLGWDMDNMYVQKILELIRRKLIVKKND